MLRCGTAPDFCCLEDLTVTFFELFLIGIGLSMDAFAVSICKGLSMQKIDKKYTLCIGLFSVASRR